jgi:hypothetical protein
MTHKLMGAGATDTFNTKGERRVLKDREVAEFKNLLQHLGDLLWCLTKQLLNGRFGIAKPRCSCNDLFRNRSV